MRGRVKPDVTQHSVNLQGKHCKDVNGMAVIPL